MKCCAVPNCACVVWCTFVMRNANLPYLASIAGLQYMYDRRGEQQHARSHMHGTTEVQ